MTVQIALCDDETADIEKTEKLLSAYEQENSDLNFLIQRFEDTGELLNMVKSGSYAPELLFLDIYLYQYYFHYMYIYMIHLLLLLFSIV